MSGTPTFVVNSRCECQASLSAKLSEERFALEGSAFLHGDRENAPAHAIHPEAPVFDVGWLCPFCGRNTMRTFAVESLQRLGA